MSIIGLDLNDGLGLCQGQRQRSMALGKRCKAEEGWAGRQFRLMLEEQKLYVGSGHTQNDDYVIISPSYAESHHTCHRSIRKWKDPQHAKVRRPLDHDPVFVQFEYAPDFFRPKPPDTPKWDVDLFGLVARTGCRRREFTARIEELASEAQEKHGPHSSMTDDKWADIVDMVQKTEVEHYTKRPLREQIDGCKEIIAEREEALIKRRRVREVLNRMGCRVERTEEEYMKAEEEQERIATELKTLTRTALKIRRRWQRTKRAALEEQLIEAERQGKPTQNPER